MEAKPAGSLELNTAMSFVEKTPTVLEIENLLDDSHKRRGISKKRRIPLLAEGSYFGRKHLFLMSLKLCKIKKRKTRKQHQNSRDKIKRRKIDLCSDFQGASTSETFLTIDVEDSMISFKKDQCSTLGMKSKRERVDKFENDYTQMSDKEIDISCITGAKPKTSKESSRSSECTEGQQNVEIKNAKDESILQNFHVSLLKANLRETTGEFSCSMLLFSCAIVVSYV